MNTQKQILYSSDEAATYKTGLSGWVDSQGRFWGEDEHLARYSGCTHKECAECGEIIEVRGYCRKCHERKRIEKYMAMPIISWDGETPLYSNSHDEYFFDEESLSDYLRDEACTVESLQLIVCEPNKFSEVENDHFYDVMPADEYEIPQKLAKALAELNTVISELPPASWSPGKFAAKCEL